MSVNLSTAAVKLFEKEAIQAFQEGGSSLRNAVRVKDAKGAKQVQFNVYGEVIANERGAVHTPLATQDPSISVPTATVKNYAPSVMTDIFLNNQVGFDARQEAIEGIVNAMNRRIDELIIEALDSATGKTVASGADNLNVSHFANAAKELGSAVPDTDRHFLCHDNGFYHFIQEAAVATMDSNFTKPLADGRQPNYLGFSLHKIGDRDSIAVGDGLGGLALSGNNRTNYAWQKNSIGLAMNMMPTIKVDWSPDYGAHRITGYLSAGSVLIQDDGVVTVTTDES